MTSGNQVTHIDLAKNLIDSKTKQRDKFNEESRANHYMSLLFYHYFSVNPSLDSFLPGGRDKTKKKCVFKPFCESDWFFTQQASKIKE